MATLEEKKFSSLSFLCKSLQIELEVLQEIDDEYGKQFAKDFTKENQFAIDSQIVIEKDNNDATSPEHKDIDKKVTHSAVKKIHRVLARQTHPDFAGDSKEFRKIQAAYEAADIITLVNAVADKNIDPGLSMAELIFLESHVNDQKENFEEIKKTARWAWGISDKSDKMRKEIQAALGINPTDFDTWLSTQTV